MHTKPPRGREADVLAILMGRPEGSWGAEIARLLEESGSGDISPGAIYVTMERLTTKGFVSAAWGKPTLVRGGRRRRMYMVTAAGRLAMSSREHDAGRMRVAGALA